MRPGLPKNGDEVDAFRMPHDAPVVLFSLTPFLPQDPRGGGVVVHDVHHIPRFLYLRTGQQADNPTVKNRPVSLREGTAMSTHYHVRQQTWSSEPDRVRYFPSRARRPRSFQKTWLVVDQTTKNYCNFTACLFSS